MAKPHLVVAVDGGGSKTRAIAGIIDFVDAMPSSAHCGNSAAPPAAFLTVLSTANSGPGNARAVGFDVAQTNIKEAIDTALQIAREQPKEGEAISQIGSDILPTTVCLSLAGVGREGDRLRMEQWGYANQLGSAVLVTTDADPLLAYLNFERSPILFSADNPIVGSRLRFSLTSATNAIALISGTGSFCFGKSSSGNRETCGGWGGLLGDEGGGYWIAMEGLKAVTRQADGRGPVTLLTQHILPYLGLQNATELIGLVYDPKTTRDQLAKIAGIVFALSAEDPIANQIVSESGRWLAELIKTVSQKLGFWEHQVPATLGFAGGNFCNQPILLEATLAELEKLQVPVTDTVRVYEPALGGFVLAAQHISAQNAAGLLGP